MLLGVLSAGFSVRSEPNASFSTGSRSRVRNHPLQTSRVGRELLRSQILTRLEHSVWEGELPECADIEALSCLCLSFVNGLAAVLDDGISKICLEASIALFVDNVGFHKVRVAKRRLRRTSPARVPALRLVPGGGKATGYAGFPSGNGDGTFRPNHQSLVPGAQPLQEINESESFFPREHADRIFHRA
jgi:hypothetical protein